MVSPSGIYIYGVTGRCEGGWIMKRTLRTVSVVVLVLVGSYASRAFAAESKVVRGTITAVAANSVSITAGTQPMNFSVDASTHVEAAGAGTKSRAAQAAGKSGVKLTELIQPGQSVEVSYSDSNGALHATSIRRISKVASVDPTGASEAQGKVTSVSASSLTIAGSSGGAKFTQTYAIDQTTHVVGKGVGTAMAGNGGRAAINHVIAVGDSVSVSYRPGADAPHASEIRIVQSSPSSK
jgi:hypothetical protein